MPYKIIENNHVRLEVRAKALEDVFKEALRGMMKIIKPHLPPRPKLINRNIKISAADSTGLLLSFMNEVLSYSLNYKEEYDAVFFKELSESHLEAVLLGHGAESFEEDIKMVIYNKVNLVRSKKRGWRTTLVFDGKVEDKDENNI